MNVQRLRRALALLVAFVALVVPAAANADPIDLHITRAETLAVEGVGFNAPPYNLSDPGVLPAGSWTAVDLPNIESPLMLPGAGDLTQQLTVTVWYRAQLPELPAMRAGDSPRYLYIPRWKSDGQITVYGDDRLIYQSHANWLWNGSNHPLWIALAETADTPMPRRITLRIERLRNTGAALSSLRVGDEESIGWRYRVRGFLQNELVAMSDSAFLAVGLFAFVVWLRGRGGQLYFLFFAMSLVAFSRGLHSYVGVQRLPVSDDWFGWITVSAMFWFVAILHYFLRLLHGQRRPWIDRMVFVHALVVTLLTLPPLTAAIAAQWPSVGIAQATSMAPLLYGSLILLVPITLWADVKAAWRHGSNDAIALAIWGVVGYVIGLYDWLQQNNFLHVEGSYMSPYAGVGVFILFMIIMLRHYTGAIDGIREANLRLESRLREREAELLASHTRLREVEQREMLAHERQRLMQDMHDGLGSSLVSTLRVVESGQLSEAQLSEMLKGCIDDLRLAIDSLEPMEADLLLLLATLRFRLDPRLAAAGVRLHWQVTDLPKLDWLEPRNSLHVLRILQEAITNTLKHTRSTEIRVATTHDDHEVAVTISDNGGGFDVRAAGSGAGKGLSNQQRRAQALGGVVEIRSSAAGTDLTLRLPITPQLSAA